MSPFSDFLKHTRVKLNPQMLNFSATENVQPKKYRKLSEEIYIESYQNKSLYCSLKLHANDSTCMCVGSLEMTLLELMTGRSASHKIAWTCIDLYLHLARG